MGSFHVAGVAGVGMSAIAELLLARGHTVSGSDRSIDQGEEPEVIERLRPMGLQVRPQDGSAIHPGLDALVVSTAIEQGNPETTAAEQHGVRIMHRARMLQEEAKGHPVIAVAGTAGKTTVTALTGWLMEQAGLDPTVVNGGVILDWQSPGRPGNVRVGRSGPWVFEVDESDRSLLNFAPERACITNISKDHFELADVVDLFARFANQVRQPVLGGPGVRTHLRGRTDQPVVEVDDRNAISGGFTHGGYTFNVPLPGAHNIENARMAVCLAESAGAPVSRLADALPRFKGVGRRLERVGIVASSTVYDDYAHNPAKIAASWRAIAETHERVLGYWRPHGFGPLSLMQHELADAFASVVRPDDRLFILPVFYAGGTATARLTSEEWVRTLQQRGLPVEYVADYGVLERLIHTFVGAGTAVLGMGARDLELPRFARRLVAQTENG